jgi:hypothetical protein
MTLDDISFESSFFHKRITLNHFFKSIAMWQELYWAYEERKKKANSASELEFLSRNQQAIAEDVARFILDKTFSVEILNNELLGKKDA